MKKTLILLFVIVIMSSCAALTNHGPATTYQRTKPAPGQPQRQIRVGPLVADILLFVWPLAIDFGTGTIYKKDPNEQPAKK